MSDAQTTEGTEAATAGQSGGSLDRVLDAFTGNSAAPPIDRRMVFAQGGNLRHVRHAQVLDKWPILPEPWARAVEEGRLASVDRTPGAATFGR